MTVLLVKKVTQVCRATVSQHLPPYAIVIFATSIARSTNLHVSNTAPPTEARIRQLERELSNAQTVIAAYKHEQTENTSLIAMYEDAMGNTTELVRNYANAVEGRFLEQRRVYNNLLQAEKDEHLASRMEKDHWFAKYMEVREMIRTANRLRTDEWCEEYAVVAGLQGQVRCLRRVLGFEAEKPEEEVGWPYLKDLPFDDTDPNP